MVRSKTQKTKSDEETIIDMEPVKEEHKNFLKNSSSVSYTHLTLPTNREV